LCLQERAPGSRRCPACHVSSAPSPGDDRVCRRAPPGAPLWGDAPADVAGDVDSDADPLGAVRCGGGPSEMLRCLRAGTSQLPPLFPTPHRPLAPILMPRALLLVLLLVLLYPPLSVLGWCWWW